MVEQNASQGLRLGSLIDGKYKVIAKVGKGGMSTVWLAMNIKTTKTGQSKKFAKQRKTMLL